MKKSINQRTQFFSVGAKNEKVCRLFEFLPLILNSSLNKIRTFLQAHFRFICAEESNGFHILEKSYSQ